ncbi:MAG: Fe-S protein assembly co-chaperone HscB [Sideroxydans sp.]|nr:Fe-S protein assembly co-chaperone HscB [Sideroxydans sp.]
MSSINIDFKQSFFQLFDLQPSFALDGATLEQRYRALQLQVHPDQAAHLAAAQQRLALQQATFVNEAYQTLRSPLRRARYLLKLNDVDTQEETNTAMPLDFLMAQMDRREAVIAAQQQRDVAALDELTRLMQLETRELEADVAAKIDGEKNYLAAAELVRKLRFMEKLAEEIHAAYDEIDN